MSNTQNQSTKPNVFSALDKKVADDKAAEKLNTQPQAQNPAPGQAQMEGKIAEPAAAAAQQGDAGAAKPAQPGDAASAKA